MSIKKVGDFYKDEGNEQLGTLPSLGIVSSNINECIKEVLRTNTKRVFGSSCYGFEEDNFDFFEKIPQITQIHFWEVDIKNIEGIYTLKSLQLFSISTTRRPKINFERFQHLETINLTYKKGDTGLSTLEKVSNFYLLGFKPKEKTFKVMEFPPNINELQIIKSNPLTLEGLGTFDSLKILELSYLRNLESIEGLDIIAPNLEKLIIEKCPHLEVYNTVEKLPKIKHISINGKVLTRDVSLPFSKDKQKSLKKVSIDHFLFADDYVKKDPINGSKGDITIWAGNKKLLDVEGIKLLFFAKKLVAWIKERKEIEHNFHFSFNDNEFIYFEYIKSTNTYIIKASGEKEVSEEALLNAIAIFIDDLHKEIIERFDYDFLPDLKTEISVEVPL